MVTLYFRKHFTKGLLKGIAINETLPFVSKERAMIWVNAIIKKERTLDYKLVNFTMNRV